MKFYVSAAFLALAAIGSCDLATFDDLKEGFFAPTITDGGITFSNYDARIQGESGPFNMTIDDASTTLAGTDSSSPNVMNFGGWSPGPTAGGGRLGELWFTDNHLVNSASLDLFAVGNGETVTLEGYRNGVLIDSTSLTPVNGIFLTEAGTLKLSGLFDSFKLTSSGPSDQNVAFGAIDNVHLNAVPEPMSVMALALGLGAMARKRRRTS